MGLQGHYPLNSDPYILYNRQKISRYYLAREKLSYPRFWSHACIKGKTPLLAQTGYFKFKSVF